ncbi:MAG: FtsX-like permease family protein [Actinoplanes sp.]
MRAATLARLAVAGNRTDTLRTVLTALSAALAVVMLLAAATVGAIRGYAERYANSLLVEPGLRPGVLIALVLVSLPVLALAGQCIRLGAPARDRRLAAIRLAGATPQEAVLIATAETTVAGAIGSVLGLGAYLLLRPLLTQRNSLNQLALPTDVLPSVLAIVLIMLAVPLVAGLIGALLMRRVVVTPLGVVRRSRERAPRPWPGVLIVAGLGAFWWLANPPADRQLTGNVVAGVLGGGVVLTMLGVVLGTGWISYTIGRLLRRYGRGAASLLAAQRLITDPWNGSRTLAALLAGTIAGALALGYRSSLTTELRAYDIYNRQFAESGSSFGLAGEDDFYYGAIRLVMVAVGVSMAVAAAGALVALVEGIVARRQAYAALTATGVPRRTLSAAILWQTLAPMVPALLIAIGAGASLARLVSPAINVSDKVSLDVPVPLAGLALLGGGGLAVMLLAAGAGLLVLRSSTDLEELRMG